MYDKITKIYEVQIETLSADRGIFVSWESLGYYSSKASAEFAEAVKLQHKNRIVEGRTRILEHELHA